MNGKVVALVAIVVVVLLLAMVVAPVALGLAFFSAQSGGAQSCSGSGSAASTSDQTRVDGNSATTSGVPNELIPIYQSAAAKYRLGDRGPSILAAINFVETSFGTNLNTSSAGAQGWMQFMPDTWKTYGVDANGDGKKDPNDPKDAIYAAAKYLRASGAPKDWQKAIFAYNHAQWYVDKVMQNAERFNVPPDPNADTSANDCGDAAGQNVSGSVQDLATQLLESGNVSFPLDGSSPNGSTEAVLKDVSRGKKFHTTCADGSASVPAGTDVDINPKLMKFLVDLAGGKKIGINAITDKCHSPNSPHYKGISVDFECRGVPFDTGKGDEIAQKYGGARNGETCAAQQHWHYDFPK